jgi:hypothetical protein
VNVNGYASGDGYAYGSVHQHPTPPRRNLVSAKYDRRDSASELLGDNQNATHANPRTQTGNPSRRYPDWHLVLGFGGGWEGG